MSWTWLVCRARWLKRVLPRQLFFVASFSLLEVQDWLPQFHRRAKLRPWWEFPLYPEVVWWLLSMFSIKETYSATWGVHSRCVPPRPDSALFRSSPSPSHLIVTPPELNIYPWFLLPHVYFHTSSDLYSLERFTSQATVNRSRTSQRSEPCLILFIQLRADRENDSSTSNILPSSGRERSKSTSSQRPQPYLSHPPSKLPSGGSQPAMGTSPTPYFDGALSAIGDDSTNEPTIRASRIQAVRAARPEVRQLFDIQLERHETHDDQDGAEAHLSTLMKTIKKAHQEESDELYKDGRNRFKVRIREEMQRIYRDLPLRDPLDESKNDAFNVASAAVAKKLRWLRKQLDRIWDEEEDEIEREEGLKWNEVLFTEQGEFALRRF